MLILVFTLALIFLALVALRQRATIAALRCDSEASQTKMTERIERADQCLQSLHQYRKVLTSCTGGIGKRISECREITEAIHMYAPGTFIAEPGLIYWLEATDQFLVELYEAYEKCGLDPDKQTLQIANSHSREIYERVHDATGLPPVSGKETPVQKWLEAFCKNVFVDEVLSREAIDIIRGGVDRYGARQGGPKDSSEERAWLELAIWFTHGTRLLVSDLGVEDRCVSVLEHLENIHGR